MAGELQLDVQEAQDLHRLDRRQLQQMAKNRGIKANQKVVFSAFPRYPDGDSPVPTAY